MAAPSTSSGFNLFGRGGAGAPAPDQVSSHDLACTLVLRLITAQETRKALIKQQIQQQLAVANAQELVSVRPALPWPTAAHPAAENERKVVRTPPRDFPVSSE
jgi:hypothetical protein